MASSFENYMIDNGIIAVSPDTNYTDSVKNVIDILNDGYLTWPIQYVSEDAARHSFTAATKNKKDPFGNIYMIKVYTFDGIDAESVPGLIVISSPGENCNPADMSTGNYDDDIVAIIEPK